MRSVQNLRLTTLANGHRLDDCLGTRNLRLVEVLQLLAHALRTRKHPEQILDRAHVLELLHLAEKVLKGEAVGHELFGDLARFLLIEGLLRRLDQGEDVTEVENAARHAVRVKGLEVVK